MDKQGIFRLSMVSAVSDLDLDHLWIHYLSGISILPGIISPPDLCRIS
jgi:hypothetical protein